MSILEGEGPIRKLLREKSTKSTPEIRKEELMSKLIEVMVRYGDFLAGQSENNCSFIGDQLGACLGLSSSEINHLKEVCVKASRRR